MLDLCPRWRGGGVVSGAFNPAVAFGACIMGLFSWSDIWIYLLANLVGGAAATPVFRYLNPGDVKPPRSSRLERGCSPGHAHQGRCSGRLRTSAAAHHAPHVCRLP
jgi:hypothetical protein